MSEEEPPVHPSTPEENESEKVAEPIEESETPEAIAEREIAEAARVEQEKKDREAAEEAETAAAQKLEEVKAKLGLETDQPHIEEDPETEPVIKNQPLVTMPESVKAEDSLEAVREKALLGYEAKHPDKEDSSGLETDKSQAEENDPVAPSEAEQIEESSGGIEALKAKRKSRKAAKPKASETTPDEIASDAGSPPEETSTSASKQKPKRGKRVSSKKKKAEKKAVPGEKALVVIEEPVYRLKDEQIVPHTSDETALAEAEDWSRESVESSAESDESEKERTAEAENEGSKNKHEGPHSSPKKEKLTPKEAVMKVGELALKNAVPILGGVAALSAAGWGISSLASYFGYTSAVASSAALAGVSAIGLGGLLTWAAADWLTWTAVKEFYKALTAPGAIQGIFSGLIQIGTGKAPAGGHAPAKAKKKPAAKAASHDAGHGGDSHGAGDHGAGHH